MPSSLKVICNVGKQQLRSSLPRSARPLAAAGTSAAEPDLRQRLLTPSAATRGGLSARLHLEQGLLFHLTEKGRPSGAASNPPHSKSREIALCRCPLPPLAHTAELSVNQHNSASTSTIGTTPFLLVHPSITDEARIFPLSLHFPIGAQWL